MRLGEKIRSLRKERRLTQQDLASALGKSRAAIGKYETGVRLPDNTTLHALCDYFSVTTDYLLGRSEQRTGTPASSLEACLAPGAETTFRGKPLTAQEKELFLSVLNTLSANLSADGEDPTE